MRTCSVSSNDLRLARATGRPAEMASSAASSARFFWVTVRRTISWSGSMSRSHSAGRPQLPAFVNRGRGQNRGVTAIEIDSCLDRLEEPKRTTLADLRATILEILPDAER